MLYDKNVLQALKERYECVPFFIFHKSVEKAKSVGELFDILEDFPKKYPIIWSEEEKRWKHSADLLQSSDYGKKNL